MANARKFWDRMAKRYAKSPVSDKAAYTRKLEITRDHLSPDMEVLEFGCGTGSTAIAQAAYVKHILAVDSSPRMLDIARSKATQAGISNVTFDCADFQEMKLTNQTFDMVMGHSILHLLPDRNAAISKSYDLLRPGGTFVSSTACVGSVNVVLKTLIPIGSYLGLLPLVRFFSREELLESIADAGFKIEQSWQPEGSDAVFVVAKRPVQDLDPKQAANNIGN